MSVIKIVKWKNLLFYNYTDAVAGNFDNNKIEVIS